MIDSVEALRRLYPEPKRRAVLKQLDRLDAHCVRYVGLAPFLVLATRGGDGLLDASPRGGPPGFVRVVHDRLLHIPDSLGNNRLDSYTNIIETGQAGMIFFIPGVDETLRVNGPARLRDEPDVLAQFPRERHPPKVVVEVDVREAYLHCAKALMRSKLWDAGAQVERSVLPSMGEMIRDQTGVADLVESRESMLARYAQEL